MNGAASGAAGRDPRRVVLGLVLASYLMIVLDISIVITGLPRIRADLGFSSASLSWVHTAYTLSFGGLLMAGARAGDLWGRRRMLVIGLALFVTASLLIGAATAPALLVAARALQGLGAAILAPATLALLSVTFPEGPERTRAVALYGATAGVGASVGMVLGGVLADLLSWRVGFFVNVPIGLVLIAMALRHLRETRRDAGRLDVAGALLSTLGMVALVFGLVEAAESGGAWASGASFATGVLLLAHFFVHEARTPHALLPLRLFRDRARSAAYAARLLFLAGVIGFWFYTTQYLQGVLGLRPLQAELAFLPATLLQFAAAMGTSRLTRLCGNERTLALGLALTAAGMGWLSRVDADSLYLTQVALPMALLGIGQGIALGPLTVAGVAGVPARDAGAASGLVNTAHQLGGSLGLALLVVVFAAAGPLPGASAQAELAHRVGACLAVGAGLLAAALAVVLLFIVRRGPQAVLESAPAVPNSR